MCHRRSFFAVLVVLIVAAPLLDASGVSGGERQVFRVPMNVEGRKVPTSAFVEVVGAASELSLAEMAESSRDASDDAVSELIQAISVGDVSKARPRLPLRQAAFAEPSQLLEQYAVAFDFFASAKFVDRISLPSGPMYVWNWLPLGRSRKHLRAFIREQNSDGEVRFDLVSSSRPCETLVLDSLQCASDEPDRFTVRDAPNPKYALPLLLRDSLVSSSLTPVLKFDGEISTFSSEGRGAPNSDPSVAAAIRIFRAARDSAAQGDIGSFLEYHTSQSRSALSKWLAAFPLGDQSAAIRDRGYPTDVVFVMNADPVFIVFFEEFRGKLVRFKYTYVARDEVDGRLRIANVARTGFFDHVLRDLGVGEISAHQWRRLLLEGAIRGGSGHGGQVAGTP